MGKAGPAALQRDKRRAERYMAPRRVHRARSSSSTTATETHMSEVSAFWSKWSPALLSVLRIVVAFLFVEHGAMKLFGYPGAGDHKAELMSLMGLAGVLEFFGGGLVLIGLFTRPVAFILAG